MYVLFIQVLQVFLEETMFSFWPMKPNKIQNAFDLQ